MAITVLLEKDSRAANVVDAIYQWAMDVTLNTEALNSALKNAREAAEEKQRASPPEPVAYFVRLLAAVRVQQFNVLCNCVCLIAESKKEDADKTATGLKAKMNGLIEAFGGTPGLLSPAEELFIALLVATAEEVAKRLQRGPRKYWQELTDSTKAVGEFLSQAVEAGKKPLPEPTGFFGRLGRKLSGRSTEASGQVILEMEQALSRLVPLQKELREVIAEMERN